jgi:transcriptional regulator with GAF, ATPase, and Fis domain
MSQEQEIRFRLRQFKTISHAISTYEDLNVLMNHLAEGASRTFNAKACCIMLYDERQKQLFRVTSCGLSEEYLAKGPVRVDENFPAFSTGETVFIEDMQNDPRVQYPEAAAQEGLVSMLCIPIKCKKAVVGIMRFYHSAPLLLHKDDIDSMCVLMENLGVVLENEGLKNFLDQVKIGMESLPQRLLEGF